MKRRPDVALDVRATTHMSVGMTVYARELAARLPLVAPDLRFTSFGTGDNFDLDEQVRMPWHLARERPRLAHFLSVYTPLFVPVRYVVTIHDLIDMHFPQYVKRKVAPYYRFGVRFVLARAARVITDDPKTVEDLERFLGVPPAKVRVIPLAVSDAFEADGEAESGPRPYVLYAGNHRRHKNLATLIAAWHALPSGANLDLYLTGRDDLSETAAAVRADGRIVFLGEVDPSRLARLYRGALAYVHPAFFEGFGLPMLEALRCGTPVIASDRAVPEVVRAHSTVVDARDIAGFTHAMCELLASPERFRERARDAEGALRALTWDRCASATAAVYRELL